MCVSPNVLKIVWLKSLPENIEVTGYVRSRSWRHHWVNFCGTQTMYSQYQELYGLKYIPLRPKYQQKIFFALHTVFFLLIACNIFEIVNKYIVIMIYLTFIILLTNVCLRNCGPIFSMGRRSLFPNTSRHGSEAHPKCHAIGIGRPFPGA
jgi:hypothetical protein